MIRIEQGDCLEVMRDLPENSVDLIATDPPYYRVKNEAWDRQWDNPAKFIEWIGELCAEWHRLLKPNGSLYVFASPKMAARVEVAVSEQFEVLNRITWAKPDPRSSINRGASNGGRICKETMRAFYPNTEIVVFAEQPNSDGMSGGSDDQIRRYAFEPIRLYLDGQRIEAGLTKAAIDDAWRNVRGNNTYMATHWFGQSQFCGLPSEVQYRFLSNIASGFFLRPYENLRREYEDLRREYEDLRRPFAVSADVPYTDVWDFPTVSAYPGKHPCEKPLKMLQHIVRASSKPGAMVLDCFAGSGTTGLAAKIEGRSAILIEREPKWVERMHDRLKMAQERPARVAQPADDTLPLFAARAVA